MFQKILIANRGEIACRVMKTAKRMGIKTVAVYSEADRDAVHVDMADEAVADRAAGRRAILSRDGQDHRGRQADGRGGDPSWLWLSVGERRLRRGAEGGGHRIHWSEHPKPSGPWATRSRARRRRRPRASRTVPGYLGVIESPEQAIRIAKDIGYPVMIKASAGGGGKGMRIARSAEEVREGFLTSTAEAKSSFGDDRVFVEKFVENPAPHRNPGAGRQARQYRLPLRARMLDPAPQPER